jgi:hypothetical protein
MAVWCENGVKGCQARRSQLLATVEDREQPDMKLKLDQIDGEKTRFEQEYSKVFTFGVDELCRLRASIQGRLLDIIKEGSVEPMQLYHRTSTRAYHIGAAV